MKFAERLQDDVDELKIDHLVVRDRSRRLCVDDCARREDQANHITHAVVEGQPRIKATNQAVKYASLDHGWAQVHRPGGLRVARREIECDDAVFDRDRNRKLDWPKTASRSEEHTSELQSPDHLVCRLLLE